jgi:hypothetical protein
LSADLLHYEAHLPVPEIHFLDSELDFGDQLQQRKCYKINVNKNHDPRGYWEGNSGTNMSEASKRKKRNSFYQRQSVNKLEVSKQIGCDQMKLNILHIQTMLTTTLFKKNDLKSLAKIIKVME